MRRKIIGAAIFFILSIPMISVLGISNTDITKEFTETSNLEEELNINLYHAPGLLE